MFSYDQVYRVERLVGGLPPIPLVTGAYNSEKDVWRFWAEADPFRQGDGSVKTMLLTQLVQREDGVIEALEESAVDTFVRLRFIPLTREYVREHAEDYGLSSDQVRDAVTGTDADFYMYLKDLNIDDDYESWVENHKTRAAKSE
jgi:hypothetical protein